MKLKSDFVYMYRYNVNRHIDGWIFNRQTKYIDGTSLQEMKIAKFISSMIFKIYNFYDWYLYR